MPRTRQQIVGAAVKANRPRSGGTSAPRSAASAPNVSPAHGFKMGVGHARVASLYGKEQGKPTSPGGGTAPGALPAPTPWSSAYETSNANARLKLQNRQNNLGLDKTAVEQAYGLEGPYADYHNNPNSRAALLEETYQEHQRGVMNNAGLQAYSGSTGNRLYGNRRAHGIEKDQLEQTYQDALAKIRDQGAQASADYGGEISDAAWKNAEHAEEEPLDPSQAPTGRKKKKKRNKRGRR